MKPHSVLSRANSAGLSDERTNGVSVTLKVPAVLEPPTVAACRLVPKAMRPWAREPIPVAGRGSTRAALQPAAPAAPGSVARSFTVTDVGTAGVRVLLTS